ncbi:MAG: diaminopimelate epimerase [Actinomycetes bacterium]
MRFEKWQALGNDYLIVERSRLPWDLTAERVRRLCHHNFGPGADGILLLDSAEGQSVASLRIFNPDGSEAALSGNGAREAAMYLRQRGWTEADTFSIETAAGTVVPTILDERRCSMALGMASVSSEDWPDGPADGIGSVSFGGAEHGFQFVNVGNPQLSIRIEDPGELEALDLPGIGPSLESDPRFPNRTNVSFWTGSGSSIRARIFERGVGETLSSGTGASGAAVAAHLSGHPATLTVELDGGELEVVIGPDLELVLTGWAVPVYSGEASKQLMEELR